MQCAQQTPITGGTKDTQSPKIDTLKRELPLNGSTNFNTQSITINFDELVVLKNADKQIIITPFLDTKPEIYTKGKKVIVEFKEELNPNTTYIINFGDAIADITEGNVFKNYKYVFSTGSYIDSLSYDAFVYNAFNKTPVKDVLVMLYKEHEDSVVNKMKPSYFGKTNLLGKCYIQNIAAGDYKVVALKDENSNYTFDPKEELIGFIDQRFAAATDTIADTIGVFLNLPEKLEILASTINPNGKGTIVLNKSIPMDSIVLADSVKSLFLDQQYTLSRSRDTIYYWIDPTVSEQKKYPLVVANCKKFNTYLKQPTDSVLNFRTNAGQNLKPHEDLYFDFLQPIDSVDITMIKLSEDSSELAFEVIQVTPTKIVIAADYQIDHTYKIQLLPGAFTSSYNVVNDTINASFQRNEANQYGNLIVSIAPNSGENFILELLRGEKVVKRSSVSKSELNSLNYPNLSSGKYSLKLIFDDNNDGFWNTGDYYKHISPERVEYYNEVIDLKKGWDMDITWIIK